MRNERMIIIGAGPAGVTAAVQAVRMGHRPLWLDRIGEIGGLIRQAWRIENFPGLEHPLAGPAFVQRLRSHAARFGISPTQGWVEALEPTPDGIRVILPGDDIMADGIILAVGTAPKGIQLEELDDEAGTWIFHEVRELLPLNPRKVLVIGGGEAAFDYSLSLSDAGAAVTIAIRSNRVLANKRLQDLVAARDNISIRFSTEAERIRRTRNGVAVGFAGDGESAEEFDAILAAVGRRSIAADLLPEAYFMPGDAMFTEDPRILVVGDARMGHLGHLGVALGDAVTAVAKLTQVLTENGK